MFVVDVVPQKFKLKIRKYLAHSVSVWVLIRACMHLRNIYAVEEHTTTTKFYPRENFPLCGMSS